jgi:hypothetical protein
VNRDRGERRVPWRLGDLYGLYGTTVGGLLLVAIAWYQASGSIDPDAQVGWTNLAVAGLIILGAGNLVWLLTGRRVVGELRRDVIARLPLRPVTSEHEPVAPSSGALVAQRGMTRYHRPECLFVTGKAATAASEPSHRRAGRRPCEVCLSDAVAGADAS